MGPSPYISQVLDGTKTSVTGGILPLWLISNQWSLDTKWNQLAADGQTLDATITVQVTNDPLVRTDWVHGSSSANWVDISSSLSITSPTTGAGKGPPINASFGNWAAMRAVCTRNSGTGRIEMYFSAAE